MQEKTRKTVRISQNKCHSNPNNDGVYPCRK